MATKYYSVVTRLGEALEATSKATGTPINFTHMAVGDGGGAPITPSAELQGLIQEKWRGELNDLYRDPENPNQVIAEAFIPETVGGFTIREAALFTEEGIMYAVGSVAPSEKPVLSDGAAKSLYLRFYVVVSSQANIALLIDPTKVLATRDYVDMEIGKVTLAVEQLRDEVEEYQEETERLLDVLDNKITSHVTVDEQYGILPWSLTKDKTDFPVNGLTQDDDGNLYQAVQPSGPGTDAGIKPISDKDYWKKSGGSEIPLFTPVPCPTGVLRPGYLFTHLDNGVLDKEAFPQAYEQLVQDAAAGAPGIVRGEAAWQAAKTANGGVCPLFMLDTDNETFRVPYTPGLYFRDANPANGLVAGGYLGDASRRIYAGGLLMRGYPNTAYGAADTTGLTKFGLDGGSYLNIDGENTVGLKDDIFDSARIVPTADENRPVTAVCPIMIKMYGEVVEGGEANIAALIQMLTNKLDVSRYEAEKPKLWESEWFDIATNGTYNFNHPELAGYAPEKLVTTLMARMKTAYNTLLAGEYLDITYANFYASATGSEVGSAFSRVDSTATQLTFGNNPQFTYVSKAGAGAITKDKVQCKVLVRGGI